MKSPGRDRTRMIRHEGEKPLANAIMIPDTLLTIQAAARAANGLSWLLIGSQAASCYMESRAAVEIEVMVPTQFERGQVERRLGPLPEGHAVVVRTVEETGVSVDSLSVWSSRARQDDLEDTTVLVPQAPDLFLLMLAERRVMQAPQAMYFAAKLMQLHGPFALADVELSPYQQERLAQAVVLVIDHAADELEKIEIGLTIQRI